MSYHLWQALGEPAEPMGYMSMYLARAKRVFSNEPNLLARLETLEKEMPSKEDLEARKMDEFLAQCTDDELDRVIAITDGNMDEMTPEDTAFLEGLRAKYETLFADSA